VILTRDFHTKNAAKTRATFFRPNQNISRFLLSLTHSLTHSLTLTDYTKHKAQSTKHDTMNIHTFKDATTDRRPALANELADEGASLTPSLPYSLTLAIGIAIALVMIDC
jgi:hypothetical protein